MVNKIQGICPSGWHFPKLSEWETLFKNIGSEKNTEGGFDSWNNAATLLKSQTGWKTLNCTNCFEDELINGSDTYGFSALPAGNASQGASSLADFWSINDLANTAEGKKFIYLSMDQINHSVHVETYASPDAFMSIRCVKDKE